MKQQHRLGLQYCSKNSQLMHSHHFLKVNRLIQGPVWLITSSVIATGCLLPAPYGISFCIRDGYSLPDIVDIYPLLAMLDKADGCYSAINAGGPHVPCPYSIQPFLLTGKRIIFFQHRGRTIWVVDWVISPSQNAILEKGRDCRHLKNNQQQRCTNSIIKIIIWKEKKTIKCP